jgi:hypothetical protein
MSLLENFKQWATSATPKRRIYSFHAKTDNDRTLLGLKGTSLCEMTRYKKNFTKIYSYDIKYTNISEKTYAFLMDLLLEQKLRKIFLI